MIIYNYLTKNIFPDKEGKRSLSPFSLLAIGSAILAISAIGYLYLGKEKALPPPSTPPPTIETPPGDSDKKTFGLVFSLNERSIYGIEITSKNNSKIEPFTKMAQGTHALVCLTKNYAVRIMKDSQKSQEKFQQSLRIRKILHSDTPKNGIQPLPEGCIEYSLLNNTKTQVLENMRYEVSSRRQGNLLECAQTIPKKEIPYLGKALIEAIETAFQKNIYHLDLKIENILYIEKGKIEIIDWEGALVIEGENSNEKFSYARNKIAETELEVLKENQSDSFKNETTENRKAINLKLIWTAKKVMIRLFGICLFELCSAAQKTPPDRYRANEDHKDQKENVKTTLLFAFDKNQANFIAEDIMHFKPERRPDLQTIRDHLFGEIQS